MLTIGDAVRWQIASSPAWYAVVIGKPPGAVDGFVVASDGRRAAIVHRKDCTVLHSSAEGVRDATAWRARYLAEHPEGLA